MFIAGNFIGALAEVLNVILDAYMWIIIISALLSWVNPDPYNPIVRFLRAVTEPVLRPIRRRIGVGMGIDVSPMIVLLVIIFLKRFVVASLVQMAMRATY